MSTMEAVMTTQDVANRFNELAQTGQWEQIQNELYEDNAVSIEPAHSQGDYLEPCFDEIRHRRVFANFPPADVFVSPPRAAEPSRADTAA